MWAFEGFFCCCSFWFFFSLKPNLLVQLLFWELQFCFYRERRVKILEMWVWARKEVAQGELGCIVNVPSCHAAFRLVVFVSWHCLLSRVQSTAVLSRTLARHKSMAPKKPGFLSCKPQILGRFDAKLLFSPPGFPLGFARVFSPQAVSVFWSGDKQ